MSQSDRFATKIGLEYSLFPLATPYHDKLQRRVPAVVRRRRPEAGQIIEIGSGTGFTTRELLAALPEVEIVSVDNERAMIRQARRAVTNQRARFVLADALVYLRSQPAASADAVASVFTIHNMSPDYRRALYREIGRVLRPGGVVVVGDKIVPDDPVEYWRVLKKEIDALDVFSRRGHPDLQAEWIDHYLEDDRIRLTEAEQTDLFTAASCGQIVRHIRWRATLVTSALRD